MIAAGICLPKGRRSAIPSEEGLEQEFNSLQAQREACEAFIASQRHEGWVCLRAGYDDGGFSGATIDRPALQRLLADIAAGRVDTIVVLQLGGAVRSRVSQVFHERCALESAHHQPVPGLVHPVAGYDVEVVRDALDIGRVAFVVRPSQDLRRRTPRFRRSLHRDRRAIRRSWRCRRNGREPSSPSSGASPCWTCRD
jgi:Resolvase, N terminal domain